ncbi:MAG: hypothetical protein ABFS34_00710 [Gemmatimonadota bacterium]
MWLIWFFVVIAVCGPIAKGIGDRIAGSGEISGKTAKLLKAELEAARQRLSSTEDRLVQVEEKLEFYERLLANPERSARVRATLES